MYHIASAVSGIMGLTILVWVLTKYESEYAVGERFVIEELVYPTPLYTFHFKPITLFVIFGFLYWTLGLEGWRNYISKIPRLGRRLIFIFFALSAFITGYEFIQNFFMWTSIYIKVGGDLDLLYHQLNPAMPKPVNFNFISKLFSMFFAGALYGIYFMNRLEKRPLNQG